MSATLEDRLRDFASERASDGPGGQKYDPELLDIVTESADSIKQLHKALSELLKAYGTIIQNNYGERGAMADLCQQFTSDARAALAAATGDGR